MQGQPGGGADYTQAKSGAVVALLDSPFAQHAQGVLNQVYAASKAVIQTGNDVANAIDSGLAAFKGLSATDQQIFVGLTGVEAHLEYGVTPISTVADYVANQGAQADVARALQVAISSPTYAKSLANVLEQSGFNGAVFALGGIATAAGDTATANLVKLATTNDTGLTSSAQDTVGWTQQAQAYFAANGPPPSAAATASATQSNATPAAPLTGNTSPDGQAVAAALTALWNTTGNASITDQTAGLKTLSLFGVSNTNSSPAEFVIENLASSPFENQANAAANAFFFNPAVIAAFSGNVDESPSQTVVGRLDQLPLAQQQLIFAGGGLFEASSLDGWKTLLNQQEATIAAMSGASAPSSAGQESSKQTKSSNANATAPVGTVAPTRAAVLPLKSIWSDANVALHLLLSAGQAPGKTKFAEGSAAATGRAATSTAQTGQSNHGSIRESRDINVTV